MLQIRQALAADVPGLVRLLRRSWLVTWAPELPFEAVQHFAEGDPARHYAEEAWSAFRVAVDGEALLGMLHRAENHIEALHVDPAHKGCGVGTALMDEAEAAIRRTHPAASLEVRAFNLPARYFYERRGWREERRYASTECGAPVETIAMRKTF